MVMRVPRTHKNRSHPDALGSERTHEVEGEGEGLRVAFYLVILPLSAAVRNALTTSESYSVPAADSRMVMASPTEAALR